jgi:cytidylate kinase
VLADQLKRDRDDSERPVAPLRPADDAVVLDTSTLDADAVIERLVELVEARRR